MNSLDKTYLEVSLYSSPIVLPRYGEHYRFGRPPEALSEQTYEPAREERLDWCWKAPDGELISSAKLADIAIQDFLDQVSS